DERQEKLRVDLVVLYPFTEDRFKPAEVHIREAQLKAENHGKNATDQRPEDTRDEELLGNNLVVLAKNVFGPEISLVVMLLMSVIAVRMYCRMGVNICSCHVFDSLLIAQSPLLRQHPVRILP